MRLDVYLFNNNFFDSREKARQGVLSGIVFINGKVVTKPSFDISDADKVDIVGEKLEFVSRGGLKLEGAIKDFGLDFKGKVVIDIGSSTGGFSQCSLKYGAKKVYAVDTGHDVFSDKLKDNPQIVSMEKTNILNVSNELFNKADLIVCDVSFVAGSSIFTKLYDRLKSQTEIVWLIKPQFECGIDMARKCRGVIKDKKIALSIARDAIKKVQEIGYKIIDYKESQILGGDGNTEYVCYMVVSKTPSFFPINIPLN